MSTIDMENSGEGELRVPGYGGVPIDFQLDPPDRFTHGIDEYQQVPAITAREMAMIEAMNVITDKRDWHEKIFDDQIAAQWAKAAAKENKLMRKKAWSWCLAELRDKAVEYREQRFVRVVDAGSCACKSDELLPASVASDLRAALGPLWPKRTDEDAAVVDVVDPDLYPLVRGESYVLEHGGCVKLEGFSRKDLLRSEEQMRETGRFKDNNSDTTGSGSLSQHLQRLPCDVEFIGDRSTDVRITSYINNLHPSHRSIYRDIEKLISASVPLWNACLTKGMAAKHKGRRSSRLNESDQTQRGRIPLRIVTFGAQWKNDRSWATVSRSKKMQIKLKAYTWAKEVAKTKPEQIIKVLGRQVNAEWIVRRWGWTEDVVPVHDPIDSSSTDSDWEEVEMTWKHPQPGRSFSYEDWKAGRNTDAAVVKMIAQSLRGGNARNGPRHERYEIELERSFRKSGLQVIVQIGGVHLPDQIRRKWSDSWGLEGLSDEHIVATTMYAYDVENVAAKMSFRQETPMSPFVYRYETGRGPAICKQDDFAKVRYRGNDHGEEIEALADVFGFDSVLDLDECLYQTVDRFQKSGDVGLPQGRLITFPNTMECCLEVEMLQGQATGHFRYVKMFLVDPHYRVCSTKNVPPQQYSWWEHAVPELLKQRGLAQELVDQIVEQSRWSMNEQQSKHHKAEIHQLRCVNTKKRHKEVGCYCF